MSLSTQIYNLLNHNLGTLNFVLAPEQRGAMTDDHLTTVLQTLKVTAESGARLAGVVYMDVVRRGGTPAPNESAVLKTEQSPGGP